MISEWDLLLKYCHEARLRLAGYRVENQYQAARLAVLSQVQAVDF